MLSRQQDMIQAKFAAAARRLGKSLKPTDEIALGKLRLTLLNAGFRSENAVAVFYNPTTGTETSAAATARSAAGSASRYPPATFR